MGPAGSYSLAAHRLNPGLTAVADENEGLEAQTGPDSQNQVGNGGRQESGSFLEGGHTVPVVNWDVSIDNSLFPGHAAQTSKLPVDLAFPLRPDHRSSCPRRFGTRFDGFLAAPPPPNLTAFCVPHLACGFLGISLSRISLVGILLIALILSSLYMPVHCLLQQMIL